MLELTLSRFTLTICAVVIMASFIGIFTASNESIERQSMERGLDGIARLIIEADASNSPSDFRLEIEHLYPLEKCHLVLRKGVILGWMGESIYAIELPEDIILMRKSQEKEWNVVEVEIHAYDDVHILRRNAPEGLETVIYIENLDATSPTTSANRSHSSNVL